jgi:hypothetical protein
VETSSKSSLYRLLAITPSGLALSPGPGPGTIETSAIETIDNDRAALSLMAALRSGRDEGRPGGPPPPGTSFTATIETMDNDVGAVSLHVTRGAAW